MAIFPPEEVAILAPGSPLLGATPFWGIGRSPQDALAPPPITAHRRDQAKLRLRRYRPGFGPITL
ncbi:MAG: hypothetical protein AAF889_07955 [Cyanobacteria bacterium P01_D01_bin.73]